MGRVERGEASAGETGEMHEGGSHVVGVAAETFQDVREDQVVVGAGDAVLALAGMIIAARQRRSAASAAERAWFGMDVLNRTGLRGAA